MIGVTLVAHLDDEGVLRTRDLTRGDHVVVGGGGVLGERIVSHQGDGLDGVGHAVGLVVVGDGLDGHIGKGRAILAQVDGGNDAVGDKRAELVVRHDDQVGAVAGGHLGGELGIHVGFGLLDDVHGHARRGSEIVSEGTNLNKTGIVRPDGKGCRSLATAGGQGGNRREHAECCDATSHYFSCVGRAGRLHQRPANRNCSTSVFVSAIIFRNVSFLLHLYVLRRAHTPKGELSR